VEPSLRGRCTEGVRGSAVLLALAFALVVVPPAGAKGLGPYRLCGADTCTEVPSSEQTIVVLDANAAQPAPPPGPYYEIDFREERAPNYRFIPSRELVGAPLGRNGEVSWYSIHGSETLVRLTAASRTLEAIPASAGDDGIRWAPWAVFAAVVALGVLLARRIRIRKPQTA
jgi:hypothetical protein